MLRYGFVVIGWNSSYFKNDGEDKITNYSVGLVVILEISEPLLGNLQVQIFIFIIIILLLFYDGP